MGKTTFISGASALTLLLGQAYAAEADAGAAGGPRSQVQAELATARQSGDIVWGDQGLTLRERFPSEYVLAPTAQGRTREQVVDELVAAKAAGEIARGDQGLTPSDRLQATAQGKTREQVVDELAAAKASGDIVSGDQGLTLRERFPSEFGTRAARGYAGSGIGDTSVQ